MYNSENNLEREEYVTNYFSGIKIYYKTIMVKAVWYG